MKKFYFQAVTRNGKTISGSVVADSEPEARTKLAQNGLAILSITNKTLTKDKATNVNLYYFKAINQEQKKVHGTIEASSDYDAYQKLRSEYHFNVLYVMSDNIPSGEKQVLKLKGIDESFVKKFNEEKKNKKQDEEKMSRDEKVELIVQLKEQQIGVMRNEISEILKNIEILLEKNKKYIDKTKNREIKERIDLLSRLKQSNSIIHLQNLTKDILTHLNADAFFLETINNEEDLEEILKKKKVFQTSVNLSQKKLEKSIENVQVNLGTINSKVLQKQIIEMKLPQKIGEFSFWIFFLLANVLSIFWIFNIFRKIIVSTNEPKIDFYFNSGIFWYFTGISFLVSLVFSPLIFSKKQLKLSTKCAIFSTAIISIFIFSFEFPAIFKWT